LTQLVEKIDRFTNIDEHQRLLLAVLDSLSSTSLLLAVYHEFFFTF
jgi:hypothetical protein